MHAVVAQCSAANRVQILPSPMDAVSYHTLQTCHAVKRTLTQPATSDQGAGQNSAKSIYRLLDWVLAGVPGYIQTPGARGPLHMKPWPGMSICLQPSTRTSCLCLLLATLGMTMWTPLYHPLQWPRTVSLWVSATTVHCSAAYQA